MTKTATRTYTCEHVQASCTSIHNGTWRPSIFKARIVCCHHCRSCDALDNAKQRRRGLLLQLHAFYAWREHTMASAQRRRRLKRAEDWYTNVHLKKHVFRVSQRRRAAAGWGQAQAD